MKFVNQMIHFTHSLLLFLQCAPVEHWEENLQFEALKIL